SGAQARGPTDARSAGATDRYARGPTWSRTGTASRSAQGFASAGWRHSWPCLPLAAKSPDRPLLRGKSALHLPVAYPPPMLWDCEDAGRDIPARDVSFSTGYV